MISIRKRKPRNNLAEPAVDLMVQRLIRCSAAWKQTYLRHLACMTIPGVIEEPLNLGRSGKIDQQAMQRWSSKRRLGHFIGEKRTNSCHGFQELRFCSIRHIWVHSFQNSFCFDLGHVFVDNQGTQTFLFGCVGNLFDASVHRSPGLRTAIWHNISEFVHHGCQPPATLCAPVVMILLVYHYDVHCIQGKRLQIRTNCFESLRLANISGLGQSDAMCDTCNR